MNSNRQRNDVPPLQGNLLRLSGQREIAIYLRDGAAWVADFNNGRAALHSAGGWYDTGNGRMLAHAQRRGEVETISPLPDEVIPRIEALHRRAAEPVMGPALRRVFAILAAVIRNGQSKVRPAVKAKAAA